MSSQAAMLKPVLWERLFERESAPISACRAACARCWSRPSSAATCRPARRCPPAATWPTTCASRATRWCSLTSSWSARAIWCRASAAAISSAIRSCRGICKTPRRAMARPPQQRRPMTRSAARWDERLRFRPSLQRNIVKPRDWQKQPYPFVYGQFDQDLFPTAEWRECCIKALSVLDIRSWAPDLITRRPALIEADPHPGAAAPGRLGRRVEIVITVGAQRGSAAGRPAGQSDDTVVGMEDPAIPTRAISSPATPATCCRCPSTNTA